MAAPAGIDCDVHPTVPDLQALFPYLDEYWRDSFTERGIPGFEANAYPPNAPLSARAAWAFGAGARAREAGDAARRPARGAAVGGGGAVPPAARHPSGLDLSARDHVDRLADVLPGGLHRLCAGVPVAVCKPHLRGRV